MRLCAAIAVLVLAGAGCVWTSGPSCPDACDKVVACTNVKGTFILSCGTVNGDCYETIASCAQCILDHDCTELGQGACDAICRPVPSDGGT